MLSFSRAARIALLSIALTATLAGCTGLRPVYSDAGLGNHSVEIAYADPDNRLEQIIYQDLALHLGKAAGKVPLVKVKVSERHANLTNNTIKSPMTARQVTVTASLTVTAADGGVLFSGSRSQTADYTNDAQALANQQAAESAAKQAALLLADTLRLQIIAALAK